MNRISSEDYTKEELIVLASLRQSSGRTCRNCKWHEMRGSQLGCFPNGVYRKWLSATEFDSGCDLFIAAVNKK